MTSRPHDGTTTDESTPPDAARRSRGSAAAELGVGFTGGVIGGLLGGGSGVFYVPALEKLAALPRPSLHGTAGAANITVCGVGAATFALGGGSLDLRSGPGLVVGATAGAFLGAKLILRISHRVLRWMFVVILIATGLKLLIDAGGLAAAHGTTVASTALIANPWFTVPISSILGFVIGAWAAGMGLGGGLLAVPALMVIFGTDLPTAEGTSLLMFFPNAIVGTIVHARQGTADGRLAVMLNAAALPGSILGALLALALDVRVLSVVFAVFALVVALRELSRMYQAHRGGAPAIAGNDAGAIDIVPSDR